MLTPSFWRRSLPPPEYELLPAPARLRFKPARLRYQAYAESVPGPNPALACKTSPRLQEVVARLGEICLSPELAHAALFPAHALQHRAGLTTRLDFPQDAHDLCLDPPAVLQAMPTCAQRPETNQFLSAFQAACLPPPTLTTFRQPIHLCAWHLESPGRVCLFTGQHPPGPIDPAAFSPHKLSKAVLDERSKRPTPSAIHLLAGDDISPRAIRQSLLHYGQTALASHRERVGTLQAQDTTLEEAVACLVHAPARNHSQIELNQAVPWDKDHIDARYAETQLAANGLRYRDWLTVFASAHALEKCRLEGHVLDITACHQAVVPMRTPEHTRWVGTRSSLPLEQRVLHDRTPPGSGVSDFTCFVRACKARLLQDLKNLPNPAPDTPLERHNVTVYEDEASNSLLVVYAPITNDKRLEFVCMTLLASRE